MRYLRGTWMRGGTSKCWIFDDEAVASVIPAGGDVGTLLVAAFGAGDPRQLDGVGGATSTTSKAAIVRRSAVPGIDVDYDFAQVGIGARRVEWGSNCGNCATAIGLYALLTGLVPVTPGRTTVRMRNTNTGSVLAATVDTPGAAVPESGTARVPGAVGGGVGVELAFLDPAGGTTGSLLPTGHPVDTLPAPATLVDAGAPAALIDAAALGLTGGEPVEDLTRAVPELVRLRREAALRMGLATPGSPVDHAVPKTGVVGPPAGYVTTDGTPVGPGEFDLAVRMLSMLAPHPAIGLTSAVAVAAAAGVPGGVVSRLLGGRVPTVLRLGTPAGVVAVGTEWDPDGVLRGVRLRRAARRIAVAEISVPEPARVPEPA
ncbi:PrpF domain-containing protein [Amycolatopsis thermophila]|uniref:2-methylaconitate cis-trans-isomerase PrpF n=1 Tax=Amycolatopsis thermophila TaxID=206084 RepID=A0ABU0F0I6_9PSEU|nr:PrpF domain-containing protein [Amycolatopsis thermophila]MDQ0381078.1 2-methylaconitate cis-trans-isomerase PrpF [Amycolatopsis thermophila]